MSKPNAVALTTYATLGEAEMAAAYLRGMDIDAWIDHDVEMAGVVRVFVWPEDAPEAADALLDLADDEPLEDPKARSRKIWVAAIAALVAISMFVTAAPAVLWPPVLLVALVLFLVWRAAGPRRP